MLGVLGGLNQPRWGTQEGVFCGECDRRHDYHTAWGWGFQGLARRSRQGPPNHQRSLGPHCGLGLVQRGGYLSSWHQDEGRDLSTCVGQMHAEKPGQQVPQKMEKLWLEAGGEEREGPEAALSFDLYPCVGQSDQGLLVCFFAERRGRLFWRFSSCIHG